MLRALVLLVGMVVAVYIGYQRMHAPAGAEASASAQSGPPELSSLRMTPEASAKLATMASGRVVLFSAAWCGYCAKARDLLTRQGVRFTELDVESDPKFIAFQREYMQVEGFPVLVIGDRIVMGYDEPLILAGLKTL